MSLQVAVEIPGSLSGPIPEMHSFIAAQRAQLARLSRARTLEAMWELAENETRVADMLPDEEQDAWYLLPWRRQLLRPEDYNRRVDREELVAQLLREGFTTDAELARLAGGLKAAAFPLTLSIRQVVQFSETLTERLANARTEDEALQLVHLRRNTEDLARRMISWANDGRL
jgi:hypothetical protein